MAIARSDIVREGEEGIYHVTVKCVRGALLDGVDPSSGKSHEKRRLWVIDWLKRLAEGFGIRILAYAVMPDHIHLALWTRPDLLRDSSGEDLARRWLTVSLKKQHQGQPGFPTEMEIKDLAGRPDWVEEARVRLSSLSWFMRCLNEYIARRANKEDGYRGRFWDGRYRCQSILDDAALMTCMAFVDLNPIRSRKAESLTDSVQSSIRLRLASGGGRGSAVKWLAPFKDHADDEAKAVIPFAYGDYLELLRWTGAKLRSGEKVQPSEKITDFLNDMGIDPEFWLEAVRNFNRMFFLAAGKAESMQQAARDSNRKWFRGYRNGSRAFLDGE